MVGGKLFVSSRGAAYPGRSQVLCLHRSSTACQSLVWLTRSQQAQKLLKSWLRSLVRPAYQTPTLFSMWLDRAAAVDSAMPDTGCLKCVR